MNNDKNEKNRIIKSIMYKMISLNAYIFLDDDNNMIVNFLVCNNKKCRKPWYTGKTECVFCGTPNPHVYKCAICDKLYSITNATKKCCNEKLGKVCINDQCISNDILVKEIINNGGGVFNKDQGLELNAMRCTYCGSKEANYTTAKINVIFDKSEAKYDEIYYILKKSESEFTLIKDGKEKIYTSIEDIVENILNIKEDLEYLYEYKIDDYTQEFLNVAQDNENEYKTD